MSKSEIEFSAENAQKLNDLISRSALLDAITTDGFEHFSGCLSSSEITLIELMRDSITEAPAVDAGPKWISVKDRLPAEHETVLILCKNGAMFTGYQSLHYEDARWKIHTALSSTKLLNKGRVTHWMPLPEPPKEG